MREAASAEFFGNDGWVAPPRHPLFDVFVSETTYDEAEDVVIRAALAGRPLTVDHMSAHGLVLATRDAAFREALRGIDLVAPDGQPVRWALNRLRGTRLDDRVYGPELMSRLCRRAAREEVGIYLYGGTPESLERLRARLLERHPRLRIVGWESPPFRPLTPDEDRSAVERINRSGAGLVFLGIGCPKQEIFAYEHRDRIQAVQLCVGAAFDFHAGDKRVAPRWMQDRGLEWLFRLLSEPRRLTGRYFVHNTLFLVRFGREWMRSR